MSQWKQAMILVEDLLDSALECDVVACDVSLRALRATALSRGHQVDYTRAVELLLKIREHIWALL